MGYNFHSFDRDQMYLMPPSVSDWLAKDHLAWFVIDAVSQIDLGSFYESYRSDGVGRHSFPSGNDGSASDLCILQR